MDDRLRRLIDESVPLAADTDAEGVLDLGEFQARLKNIRDETRAAREESREAWSRKVGDLRESLRRQRIEHEDALLEEMAAEEKAMLARHEDLERRLRNLVRIFRALVEERNELSAAVGELHAWIRDVELHLGKRPHRDHGADLEAKYFVEYVARQAWIFDNQGGWDIEEEPRKQRRSSAGPRPA